MGHPFSIGTACSPQRVIWNSYCPRPKPEPTPLTMANTRLSNPVIVAANNDVKPSNVNVLPANGSDGTYTWACVGQKDTGSTSVITFSVTGTASSPSVVAGTTNQLRATCQVKAATTNYVQVAASYVSPSNSTNWTIVISGSGTSGSVKFTRGNGGGTARKPVVKAAVTRAAKPAAKKATKKAARKAAKPARKAAKPARKAAKPARKAAKPARKARGK